MRWGPIILLLLLAMCVPLGAQSVGLASLEIAAVSNVENLPDAPSAVVAEASAVEPLNPQPVSQTQSTHEILAGDPYRPLTKHEKWEHFLRRTYAPATFVGAGEDTAYARATGGFVYCCGIGSWGEQYAAIVADNETRQFFGNFLFPTLLKQDPRYFPRRTGGMFGRAWYAATRVLITRNDSGNAAFNYSEVMGVAFAKAVSNSYYPDRQRGGWETANRIIGTFQSDATSNLVREFWPDIRRLAHRCTPRRWQERLSLPDAPSQY